MSNSTPQTDEQAPKKRGFLLRVARVVGGVVGVVWLATCFLFVGETEVVVVSRLGGINAIYDKPEDRGLQLKLPWPIDRPRRFDRRIQIFDPLAREMFTRDKKNVTIDVFVAWRIADKLEGEEAQRRPVEQFLRSVGSIELAQAQLETRVRGTLAARMVEVELSELMQVSDPASPPVEGKTSLQSLNAELLSEVKAEFIGMGIDVVDVRIKRIGFPTSTQQAVFERMKSERQKIADRYRSAGLAENTVIRSQADRQYSQIISKAEADAERIRGEGEAQALAILNKAHVRDPEFYRFVKTLDSYEKILNDKTTLVLSASNSLLKLLVNGVPEMGPVPVPREGPQAKKSTAGPPNRVAQEPKLNDGATKIPADETSNEASAIREESPE
jgi:membrane protease subunit HflC